MEFNVFSLGESIFYANGSEICANGNITVTSKSGVEASFCGVMTEGSRTEIEFPANENELIFTFNTDRARDHDARYFDREQRSKVLRSFVFVVLVVLLLGVET